MSYPLNWNCKFFKQKWNAALFLLTISLPSSVRLRPSTDRCEVVFKNDFYQIIRLSLNCDRLNSIWCKFILSVQITKVVFLNLFLCFWQIPSYICRNTMAIPEQILRVVALGPLSDDRRIILIEMPTESAKNYAFAMNVIMDRLKGAELMLEPDKFFYWIGKSRFSIDVVKIASKSNFVFFCRPWKT